ncbi:hypothetical protein EVAR_6849_1 [Eumeta japonica]|uniref:Uncharacterized protein n=1 Tax=Eumeta variegata TaxID=151549 RepID=A0A4C1U718_EUMVA|nr:hypothetical protein EVAR_6849_1 [Eumeta japonica]
MIGEKRSKENRDKNRREADDNQDSITAEAARAPPDAGSAGATLHKNSSKHSPNNWQDKENPMPCEYREPPFVMPRFRVRKTYRKQSDLSRHKDAYEDVKAGDWLRKAGDKHGIKHCSLLRYLRKRHASSHYIQRADLEKSGFNAPVLISGLTETTQKVGFSYDCHNCDSDLSLT